MLTARLAQIPDMISATEPFGLIVEILDEATGQVVEDLTWKVMTLSNAANIPARGNIFLVTEKFLQMGTVPTYSK